MRIYLATSMRNGRTSAEVAEALRRHGHTVFDPPSQSPDIERELARQLTAVHSSCRALTWRPEVTRLFLRNHDYAVGAQGCVLLVPAGLDSHLAAGFIAGRGRPLWVFGDPPVGEFHLMYNLAHDMAGRDGLRNLLASAAAWEAASGPEMALWNVELRERWPRALASWERLEAEAARTAENG